MIDDIIDTGARISDPALVRVRTEPHDADETKAADERLQRARTEMSRSDKTASTQSSALGQTDALHARELLNHVPKPKGDVEARSRLHAEGSAEHARVQQWS